MALKKKIRKYDVGGLANLGDSRIPKPTVEVYVRPGDGQPFHVGSLHEGIYHLLSNEGYRLGIYEDPDGLSGERFGVVIRRDGNRLYVTIQSPITNNAPTLLAVGDNRSEIYFDLDPKPIRPLRDIVVLHPLDELREAGDLQPAEPRPVMEDVEVTIDGT